MATSTTGTIRLPASRGEVQINYSALGHHRHGQLQLELPHIISVIYRGIDILPALQALEHPDLSLEDRVYGHATKQQEVTC